MVWSELTQGDEARKGYYMSKYMREIFQRRWYLVKDSKGEKGGAMLEISSMLDEISASCSHTSWTMFSKDF